MLSWVFYHLDHSASSFHATTIYIVEEDMFLATWKSKAFANRLRTAHYFIPGEDTIQLAKVLL